MRRLGINLRTLRYSTGVAAVEFALIFPILVVLLGAAVDLGTMVENSVQLENAARTGAQFATRDPSDTTGAQAAALAVLPGWSSATATATMVCQCPASGSATGGSVVGCSTACTSGMAVYVTVTTTNPFTPIFPTSSLIPFNAARTLSRSVVIRVQ